MLQMLAATSYSQLQVLTAAVGGLQMRAAKVTATNLVAAARVLGLEILHYTVTFPGTSGALLALAQSLVPLALRRPRGERRPRVRGQ